MAKRTSNTNEASQQNEGFDDIHTAANPYCRDLNCWCHTNIPYHDEVMHPLRQSSDEQRQQAYSFFGLRK